MDSTVAAAILGAIIGSGLIVFATCVFKFADWVWRKITTVQETRSIIRNKLKMLHAFQRFVEDSTSMNEFSLAFKGYFSLKGLVFHFEKKANLLSEEQYVKVADFIDKILYIEELCNSYNQHFDRTLIPEKGSMTYMEIFPSLQAVLRKALPIAFDSSDSALDSLEFMELFGKKKLV